MGQTFQFAWEVKLMQLIQSTLMNSQLMITMMTVFTYIGDAIPTAVVIIYFYLVADKDFGRKLALTSFTSLVVNNYIKNIFLRRRPYFDNEGINCYLAVDNKYDLYDIKGQGFSFPSAHSNNVSSIFWSLYARLKTKKAFIIACLACFIIAFSRVSLGCHYPTDTFVGIGLGIIFVVTINYLMPRINKKVLYLIIVLITSSGFFFATSYDFYATYGILVGFIIADLYEDKYVKFENTKNILRGIIRMVFAGIIFLGIAEGIKLFFPASILDSATPLARFIRALRYGLGTFAAVGLYPRVFKYNLLKIKGDN